MRFFAIIGLILGVNTLSGCCGNFDTSVFPCYKETFLDTKEESQKKEYELEKKRAPRFNR